MMNNMNPSTIRTAPSKNCGRRSVTSRLRSSSLEPIRICPNSPAVEEMLAFVSMHKIPSRLQGMAIRLWKERQLLSHPGFEGGAYSNISSSLKKAFTDQIHDIIELKDERIIACSEDKTIKIFEKNGNPQFILKGHTSGVRALCLLKNDRFASGSADKTVRIWGLKHQKTIKVLKDQSNPIISFTLSVGDKLASSIVLDKLI